MIWCWYTVIWFPIGTSLFELWLSCDSAGYKIKSKSHLLIKGSLILEDPRQEQYVLKIVFRNQKESTFEFSSKIRNQGFLFSFCTVSVNWKSSECLTQMTEQPVYTLCQNEIKILENTHGWNLLKCCPIGPGTHLWPKPNYLTGDFFRKLITIKSWIFDAFEFQNKKLVHRIRLALRLRKMVARELDVSPLPRYFAIINRCSLPHKAH